MRVRPPLLLLVTSLALVAVRCAPPRNHVPVIEAWRCMLTPEDSYWHADVRDLPVHPLSDSWIESIGDGEPLQAAFGSGLVGGAPFGIPYRVVGASQPMVLVAFRFFLDADPGPYPIPPDAPIEGGDAGTGNRRVIVLDHSSCTLYELLDATRGPGGAWQAASGAVFDLDANELHPAGRMSADEAGLAILPGLVRYEEVALGHVGHALRFTAPNTRRAALWPARNFTSSANSASLPPMGAWFRLKADVDPADFSAGVRPIVEALQRHGMILTEHGSPWTVSGVPSEHWDDAALLELASLEGEDFEAVDASSLMVDGDSGAAAPPPAGLPD